MTWQEAKRLVTESLRAHNVPERFPSRTFIIVPTTDWENLADCQLFAQALTRELRKRGAEVIIAKPPEV